MDSISPSNLTIRPIERSDNAAVASVIREVSAEYGLTADKGYSVSDPTLDSLYEVYNQPDSRYWVIEFSGKVVGGAGIAPLAGEDGVCELQKMYFLPEARGKGIASKLAELCFEFARGSGFTQCYLETTNELTEAIMLYRKLGFQLVSKPMGNTGHTDCEIRMLKQL
ncbi:GNAT family N-acetyltransferase [Vibrio hannami]|uniref:GNAT family N-acetyltransferase n=1 Tax=Vibrio hannami TaxID=2717094 RepID=UPI0024106853|nr:GNAT family N-acetyltransferase [Vibrio hannami]MDG3084745.1 GNAT family N-acetyltransferase [Vibrio hannami]